MVEYAILYTELQASYILALTNAQLLSICLNKTKSGKATIALPDIQSNILMRAAL